MTATTRVKEIQGRNGKVSDSMGSAQPVLSPEMSIASSPESVTVGIDGAGTVAHEPWLYLIPLATARP